MVQLDFPIKEIDRIYHLADIHIRNYKRHKEYRKVFSKLYNFIKRDKTDNSVIYVAGDLVHSKLDMSPELVELVGEFLHNLADIAPVIVILGNHDLNLNNKSRLDAISPVVSLKGLPNIHLLTKNEVYRIAQIGFSVMEVATDPSEFIPASSFEAPVKIALHHGAVNRALTDTNVGIRNEEVTINTFKGYDLALLGDIHKRQFLDPLKRIAYPGSLIQQNYGETLENHGLLVWDVPSLTSRAIDIVNDQGFVTLDVRDGKLEGWSELLPKHPRLRLKVYNTSATQLQTVLGTIKTRRKVTELNIIKQQSSDKNNLKSLSSRSVRDVEYQNELIEEYLQLNTNITDKTLDAVRHLNRTINTKLEETEITRNKSWEPVFFKFSNMFSYGVDNYIDFEGMRGLYGIFAPNASGKSTLLDALCYCIFDKCSRTYKGSDVLNVSKNYFDCTFCFSLGGVKYYIEKRGSKAYRDRIKVDVDFYYLDSNNKKISLNGDQRDSTNKVIRRHIGTYEDFIMTALSTQITTTDFINKTQRERKELLTQFLDLDVFEELYKIASEESKDIAAALKILNEEEIEYTLKNVIEPELELVLKSIEKEKKEVGRDELSLGYLREEYFKINSKMYDIEDKVEESKEQLEGKLKELDRSDQIQRDIISSSREELIRLKEDQEKLSSTISFAKAATKDYHTPEKLQEVSEMYRESSTKLAIFKADLVRYEKDVETLKDHEYDPDCKFCIQNKWVILAKEAAGKIPKCVAAITSLEYELGILLATKEDYSKGVAAIHAVRDLQSNLTRLTLSQTDLESKIDKARFKIDFYNSAERKNIEEILAKLESQKLKLEHNSRLQKSLNEITDKIDGKIVEVKRKNEILNNSRGKYSVLKERERVAREKLERKSELSNSYECYNFYLESVKRDSIPYMLIERTIPELQDGINAILNQIVEFNMILHSDGKNINGMIVYDEKKVWPLELTSGMERFICSLAIRVALINITTLPKPNFIAIDEGFGVLDSENINNIYLLFDYLKTQFDFMFCISHIDMMRDIVDTVLEINKVDGFSKIHHG